MYIVWEDDIMTYFRLEIKQNSSISTENNKNRKPIYFAIFDTLHKQ
jgi:hypothetical protein